jgi:hypothetical protein
MASLLDARVFNWRFYLYNNPDLVRFGLVSQAQAESHWSSNGIHEGRQGHLAFHAAQYAQNYPDLKAAFGSNYAALAAHYTNNGLAEGRVGHSLSANASTGRATLTSKYTGQAASWWNPLTVGCSAKFAGAIDSIMWKDFEFINSYDHGRQASFAWQYGSYQDGTPLQPRFSATYAEIFNPTEAGSETDAVGWASSSHLTYAKRIDTNVLDTSAIPAYWKSPAESQGQYTATDSKDTFRKVVVVSPMGIPNLTRISSFVTPEQGNNRKAVPTRYEAPALYINPELANFYECNTTLTALTQVPNTKEPKFSNSDMWNGNPAGGWFGSQGGEVQGVVIAADNKGHAIGAVVVPQPDFKVTYQLYFQNYQVANTTPVNNTRAMGPAIYVTNGSRYREFTTYLAVGATPQEVMATLKQALDQRP